MQSLTKQAGSFLADNLLNVLQKHRAIHNCRCGVLDDPLLADHPFRIDKKERSVCVHGNFVEYAVAADDLTLRRIAEQRVRQF